MNELKFDKGQEYFEKFPWHNLNRDPMYLHNVYCLSTKDNFGARINFFWYILLIPKTNYLESFLHTLKGYHMNNRFEYFNWYSLFNPSLMCQENSFTQNYQCILMLFS